MPKKNKNKVKYPRVIGLAFISMEAVKIVLNRNEFAFDIYKCENSLNNWIKHENKTQQRKIIVLLPEGMRSSFPDIIKNEKIYAVITFCNYTWLHNRSIDILDATQEDGGIAVQQTITPQFLHKKLNEGIPYKPSSIDKWLAKGKPKLTRNSEDYSLANLIYVALKKADEGLLMINPKDFWLATYSYCLNDLAEKEWLSKYCRPLVTAGVQKQHLKKISNWVKKHRKQVVKGKNESPISKLDLKMAKKLKSSK